MRIVSPLLIAAGVILLALGFNVPNLWATFIVDATPPQIQSLSMVYGSFDSPDPQLGATALSDSQTTPGMLYPGKSGQLTLIIYEANPQSADVSIDASTGQTLATYAPMTLHSQSGTTVRYVYNWNVPSQLDVRYTFTVRVTDVAGNTARMSFYGKVGNVKGYFTVNGIKINSASDVITLNTRTLNFEFYATESGSSVDKVQVVIRDQNGNPVGIFDNLGNPIYMTEAVADQKWTQTFTIPADGRYSVEGRVYVLGAGSVVLMSINLQYSSASVTQEQAEMVSGLILVAVGALLYKKSEF